MTENFIKALVLKIRVIIVEFGYKNANKEGKMKDIVSIFPWENFS
jgi:hypothetical protein